MKRDGLFGKAIGIFLVFGLLMTQCTKETMDEEAQQPQEVVPAAAVQMNPNPAELGALPPATVELKTFEPNVSLKNGPVEESSLEPALLEISLRPGESTDEDKLAFVAPAPPKSDILFMLDLTGSMWQELANVKTNSINIMNAIRAVIPDSYFGASSHMDYSGNFSGCGYANTYGGGIDYPYLLDQDLTASIADVSTALNGMPLGWGADGPESYVTALDGATMTSSWRAGAKKIVIAWGDNIPHDCGLGTGPEPGPDDLANTADDLVLNDVLNAMAAENVTLLALHSGSYLSLWDSYAAVTGGDAVQINSNGTIPGGTDIETFITDLVEAEFNVIDELTLEVCDEAYAEWLTDVKPVSYTNIDLTLIDSFEFVIELTVPEGTASGVYEFDICLMGDGVEYATQHVIVKVTEVPLDMHPRSCPNPVNRNSKGKYPAAILGTEDIDVTTINPESLVLKVAGVEGEIGILRYAFEDISTPYDGDIDYENPDRKDCTDEGPDGNEDMTLKFSTPELATLLSGFEIGDVLVVYLEGEFENGEVFFGRDILWIVN